MTDAREAARLVNLARLHLAGDDLAACAAACRRALALGPDGATRARLDEVLADLRQRDPAAADAAAASPAGAPADVPAPPGPARPRADTEDLVAAARDMITPDLVDLLRRMAPDAGAAAGEASPSLDLLEAAGALLAADLDLDATLDLVLDLTLRSTGARRGFVLLRDARGGLAVERRRGLARDALPGALSSSVLAEARRTRRPVLTPDARDDPRFRGQTSVEAAGLRSLVCVPIFARAADSELIGAIWLEDETARGRFGPADVGALADLATLVAGPLRRARRHAAERRALAEARRALGEPLAAAVPRIVGESAAVGDLLDALYRAAPADAPVLLQGETGTGKELAAGVLHGASGRAAGPFVAENCGALPESIVEAELFGVVRGAFTGADRDRPGLFRLASSGTLFLDEVGELAPGVQAKLLRVLEEGEVRPVGGEAVEPVDVRLVAASHRDLAELVRTGRFREDLYYRLNVLPVRLPPLRERPEDVPLLVEHFLDLLAPSPAERPALAPATRARLAAHTWPGNVRELKNAVWRLVVQGDDGAPWLDEAAARPAGGGAEAGDGDAAGAAWLRVDVAALARREGAALPLREARARFEAEYLRQVLARHGASVTRSAEALGLQRAYLSRLLKKLGVARKELRPPHEA